MPEPDYEYHGLMAVTWDLFRGDTSGWSDRPFYREVISRYGEPVLDVGCGSGRLLLDYLQAGVRIEGVDNSPEMLALCREKAASLGLEPLLYHQQMESLDLPERYRTVLVPSSSFQLLTDPSAAQEAMRRLRDHLLPGGALVMPFMRLDQQDEATEGEWRLTGEKAREPDGTLFRRWSRGRFDPLDGCEHTEDRYEALRDGVVVAEEFHRRSPATRSYTLEQGRALYGGAGFTEVQALRGFTFEPAEPGDAIVTLIGLKP